MASKLMSEIDICQDLRIPIKMEINKCEGGWEAIESSLQ